MLGITIVDQRSKTENEDEDEDDWEGNGRKSLIWGNAYSPRQRIAPRIVATLTIEIEGQEELRRSAIRIQKRLLSLLGWFSNMYTKKLFRCRESEGDKVGHCQP
jgi:hypothetical protein